MNSKVFIKKEPNDHWSQNVSQQCGSLWINTMIARTMSQQFTAKGLKMFCSEADTVGRMWSRSVSVTGMRGRMGDDGDWWRNEVEK